MSLIYLNNGAQFLISVSSISPIGLGQKIEPDKYRAYLAFLCQKRATF
jgi:hypothetical protein